jgi:hypothetical protein
MGANAFSYKSTVTTASGASAPFQVGRLTTLAVDVSVTAVAGAGTVAPIVERLGDDGVWYPIWNPAALTAVGLTSTSIGAGCTTPAVVTSTLRFRWVITGTSVTFSASIIAR